ncbi:hypothetical protein [Vibrio diazotrophicus]|uniref:hypothetical protein n=1 Tax=Vibrio diazotrophicus TaxID=685 RepID=UPI00142E24CD|nr:hypothetical protein [Vibrio diazotrophicus]NIY93334.1 hypothetical protein [Vibrio diazotrophicus]
MSTFIKTLTLEAAVVLAVMYGVRTFFDYLSVIALVDYLAYSGICILILAVVSIEDSASVSLNLFGNMIQRETIRSDDKRLGSGNKGTFSIRMGIIGISLLMVSAAVAYLAE